MKVQDHYCSASWWSAKLLACLVTPLGGLVSQEARFSCWPEFFGDAITSWPPTVVDFDANGIVDIVRQGTTLSYTYPGPCRGIGDGRFQELLIFMPPGIQAWVSPTSGRPGAADVDADGLPDLILSFLYVLPAPNDHPIYLLRNQGGGQFAYDSSGRLPLIRAGTNGVVFGDIDLDGDKDMYIGTRQGADYLLINDGSGFYTDESTARLPRPLLTTETGYVAVGDVTGDGLPDIVRAGFNTTSFVLVNSGFGTFTQGQILGAGDYLDLELADVDGDGDLDIYFPGRLTSDRLWINQGGGAFVDETAARGIHHYSESVDFADFDQDGDQDMVLGATETLFVDGAMRPIGPVLLDNDGTGVFTNIAGSAVTGNRGPILGGGAGTLSVRSTAVSDFDNDGDVDAFLTFYSFIFGNQKETMMMFNLKRHIRCQPQVARGGTAQVECYADAGHLIAPVLSFAPASTSLGDLGRLMIDPTSTIPLPIAFFASQGRIDRPVPIPNDPAFAGWIVYSQAIDLWDEAGVPKAHLTNVTQFRIQ